MQKQPNQTKWSPAGLSMISFSSLLPNYGVEFAFLEKGLALATYSRICQSSAGPARLAEMNVDEIESERIPTIYTRGRR